MSFENSESRLRQLVSRYANSFDLKDWTGLEQCLAQNVYTDYSELRGTPPELISREQFVELRRDALGDLETHHLSGNIEIAVTDDSARLRVSMVIYRRNSTGDTLNTHCLYLLGAERSDEAWVFNSITQKILINVGKTEIHSGIKHGDA